MATIKSYTNIEQSRKLAKILPIESADMYYWCGEDLRIGGHRAMDIDYDIPCWSLNALLEVIPQSITKYIESERCQRTFHLNLFRSYYHCCSYCFGPSVSDNDGNNTLYCIGRDNWVDACYEMIIHLHELKML